MQSRHTLFAEDKAKIALGETSSSGRGIEL